MIPLVDPNDIAGSNDWFVRNGCDFCLGDVRRNNRLERWRCDDCDRLLADWLVLAPHRWVCSS